MATTNITIKLLIDTKENKVLFAEASKDFVDFLFYLLALPIGTVIKLLTSQSMVGSIGNLYTSFANLNETYLQPNLNKNVLLNPKISTSLSNIPLLITGSSTTSKKFYACAQTNRDFGGCNRSTYITDIYNAVACPNCSSYMAKEMTFVPASKSNSTVANTNAYKDSDGRRIPSGTSPNSAQQVHQNGVVLMQNDTVSICFKNKKKHTHSKRCRFGSKRHRFDAPSIVPPELHSRGSTPDSDGYVQEVVSYMISDDLSVTSMSMISSISMINKFNVSKLDLLEEREVQVGTEEGLELLKTSFQSKTVLTEVFLRKKKGKRIV